MAFAAEPTTTTIVTIGEADLLSSASAASVSAVRAEESAILADALAGIRSGFEADRARAAAIASSSSVEAANAEASKDASAQAAYGAAVATSMADAQYRAETSAAAVASAASVSAESVRSVAVASASAAVEQHKDEMENQALRVAQAAGMMDTMVTSTLAATTIATAEPSSTMTAAPANAPVCGGMEAKQCEGGNLCVPNPINGCNQIWTGGSCEGMCVRRDGTLAGGIA